MTATAALADRLAQEIRRVDGNHSLGAAALAEALMPFIASLAEPGEVGPAAWTTQESLRMVRDPECGVGMMNSLRTDHINVPLYTHPAAPAGVSDLAPIRTAVADYMRAEGCSCCRDTDAHEVATKRLAELLSVEPYSDGSGYDFAPYRSTQEPRKP